MREFPGNGIQPAEFSLHAITTGRKRMTYRTYSGPRGPEPVAPMEMDRLATKEFASPDTALAWARHVNDGGRVALLIEGDDGTHLGKREIAGALHHREAPPR